MCRAIDLLPKVSSKCVSSNRNSSSSPPLQRMSFSRFEKCDKTIFFWLNNSSVFLWTRQTDNKKATNDIFEVLKLLKKSEKVAKGSWKFKMALVWISLTFFEWKFYFYVCIFLCEQKTLWGKTNKLSTFPRFFPHWN